ncbi:tyrosine-type recombinase/integrase [Pantoea sp. A4]|uniref:tyrosine-type recombinase/integrase n=1 Tax=Pantoea sp. A4 TaxID=1225184 RepID=UPI000474C431|nr:tyrosine-type recombinase/integrase [Pantoea sp. A4]
MLSKRIRYTFKRHSIYYVQFCLPDGKVFRRSLNTDSHRETGKLMIALMPLLLQVRAGQATPSEFNHSIDNLIHSRMVARTVSSFPAVPIPPPQPLIKEAPGLTLTAAWEMYKAERGVKWTVAIASANERYIEPLMALIGPKSDVKAITHRDIRHTMESVVGLPKRVIQPYRSMTIHQLLACDDVPEKDLIGTEAIHKHLKIFKSLFKTFLTNEKGVLDKSPTDGITSPPSSARFGAYTTSEMRSFVSYAINEAECWVKWVILLLAYTGARRSEIATLTKESIRFDDDSIRHYLLISEGKTDNATRQIPIHQHLIDLGFLKYVNRHEGKLFPEVAATNMAKIGKELTTIRERLAIPYLDIHKQRRIVHSFRHSVVTSASGWVSNISHLQQVIGHEKTGTGITRRYLHTFPLSAVCYVIDGLNWI